jgi:hypothetical protein
MYCFIHINGINVTHDGTYHHIAWYHKFLFII